MIAWKGSTVVPVRRTYAPPRLHRGGRGGAKKAPDGHTILVNGALAAGLVVMAAAAVIWVPFLEPIRHRFENTDPGWVVVASSSSCSRC